MFKIGEFSQIGQISIRMLRHYDKLGLLKPEHVDKFTGYRYYTIDQLPRLNRLLALKDLGFSLEQVKDLLNQDISVEQLEGMLMMKQAEIQQHIHEEQQRLNRVAARLRQIQHQDIKHYDVVLKQPDQHFVASMRNIVPAIDDMQSYRCTMLDDIYTWLDTYGIASHAPEMMIYHHMGEFHDENIDMEVAVPIPDDAAAELGDRAAESIFIRQLASKQAAASTIHQGHIIDLPQAIIALFSWINQNQYTSGDTIREIHLSGRELEIEDFENITFEIQIPAQPITDSSV
jgi:DNA-binding transcriptional MerR regulator